MRTLLALGLALTVGLTGCLGGSGDADGSAGDARPLETHAVDGFEDDVPLWRPGADVPADPNRPGLDVDWDVARSVEHAKDGASLRFLLDGSQDEGTVWVYRAFPVTPGTAYDVSVAVDAWSPGESFNTVANLVMYAGFDAPAGEADFDPASGAGAAHAAIREPLDRKEGWDEYALEWRSPAATADEVVIAFGITVAWESELVYHVDDVRVTMVPADG